ncbi:MAG: hypothetical protein LWY06_18665, partial [Firmicutes bacterium]|nr:hypothetical protein [Bacillota bacterium]
MKIFIVLFYIFGLFAHGNTPKYSEYTINTVWKNNNEILLHKRIVEVRYGVDDTFAWKNEKILIYDLLQRRTRDFLNGRYSTKSKFVISPDGNRIFQYCYSDKMMYLFDNNWRKLSMLPQKNLIINPRDDNCQIYDKYLFRNEYAQNKPALAVTDLITGETKMIPVKDSLLPADIPMFDMEYKFPVFRSQK